jgi:hypothetical protein
MDREDVWFGCMIGIHVAWNGVIVLESCLYGSNSSVHKRQLLEELSDCHLLRKDSSPYSSLSYTFISK